MAEVKLGKIFTHSKASERYVETTITFEDGQTWEGLVPIEYRRTGLNLAAETEIVEYVESIVEHLHPDRLEKWKLEQEQFWRTKPRAAVTKKIFDVLNTGEWICTSCAFGANTNPARRYQDIKEFGYTIATVTQKCKSCDCSRTHLCLLPIPRGGVTGYEVFPGNLKTRIIKLLGSYDAYEGRKVDAHSLLPDHKFPEIRWDNETRRTAEALEALSDEEIRRDFQLLNNQRNQQKREACRGCFQTGKRPKLFSIDFYYWGDEDWPPDIPKRGKDAERGCVGCGWYDMERWRLEQNRSNVPIRSTIAEKSRASCYSPPDPES